MLENVDEFLLSRESTLKYARDKRRRSYFCLYARNILALGLEFASVVFNFGQTVCGEPVCQRILD